MLNTTMQTESHDYSGRSFIGIVVDNNDPLMLRRVKVYIPNLFETKSPADLPWVAPMHQGIVANCQSYSSYYVHPPVLGSEVTVEFQDGDPMFGLWTSSPMRPTSIINEFVTHYLRRYGWTDPIGNIFRVDTTPGDSNWRVLHSSGWEFTVKNNGDTKWKTPGRIDFEADDDITFKTKRGFRIDADEEYWMKCKFQADIDVGLNFNILARGAMNTTVRGSRTEQIDGNSNIQVDGNNLNQTNGNSTWHTNGDHNTSAQNFNVLGHSTLILFSGGAFGLGSNGSGTINCVGPLTLGGSSISLN